MGGSLEPTVSRDRAGLRTPPPPPPDKQPPSSPTTTDVSTRPRSGRQHRPGRCTLDHRADCQPFPGRRRADAALNHHAANRTRFPKRTPTRQNSPREHGRAGPGQRDTQPRGNPKSPVERASQPGINLPSESRQTRPATTQQTKGSEGATNKELNKQTPQQPPQPAKASTQHHRQPTRRRRKDRKKRQCVCVCAQCVCVWWCIRARSSCFASYHSYTLHTFPFLQGFT